MIQRYVILIAEDTPHLQDQVNQMIKDGWQPLGGVATTATGKEHGDMAFCQAMGQSAPTAIYAYGGVNPAEIDWPKLIGPDEINWTKDNDSR